MPKSTRWIPIWLLFCLNIPHSFAQNADYRLLYHINHSGPGVGLARVASDAVTPLSLALPLGVGIVGLAQKSDPKVWAGLEGFAGLALASGTSYIIKHAVSRPRPHTTHPDIDAYSGESANSFPSGHTTAAFATATYISLAYPKWYVIVPAYTYATAAGWSRMRLGVHYPTDVLAGAALGSASAIAMHYASRGLRGKQLFHRRKIPALEGEHP